jgi:hypothetical protein
MKHYDLPAADAARLRASYARVPSPYRDPQGTLIGVHKAFSTLPDSLLRELFRAAC